MRHSQARSAASKTKTKTEKGLKMKEQILEFVRDHWQRFGAYPLEVETENEILTWDQYWSYITEDELESDAT
jgi:phosphoribosylformylglycinamidine (FGAM) synthase-like enzyme